MKALYFLISISTVAFFTGMLYAFVKIKGSKEKQLKNGLKSVNLTDILAEDSRVREKSQIIKTSG